MADRPAGALAAEARHHRTRRPFDPRPAAEGFGLLLTPQGVASGGRETGATFWGNAEYTLNVDTGKAGLWPGGFLRVIAQSGFGENVRAAAGAISAVNTPALLTRNEPNTGLMPATFTQFLSPHIGLGTTLVGLVLTVIAAFAAGVAGRWLSRALSA